MKKLLKGLEAKATSKATNKNMKLVQSISLDDGQVLDANQIVLGQVSTW